MHAFAPKCAFLKRKEAFNQSLSVKMAKDCMHGLNLIQKLPKMYNKFFYLDLKKQ